jgi:hypothetical protein
MSSNDNAAKPIAGSRPSHITDPKSRIADRVPKTRGAREGAAF